jgi:hypothetical protein
MFVYVWGWSYIQRMSNPQYVEAKDEKTARKMIRERFNLRTTRNLSIVPQSMHDYQVKCRDAAIYGTGRN